jgi:hypothetical protein
MPSEYQIDTDQRFIHVTYTGAFGVADILALQSTLAADPEFSPDFVVLTDLRAAEPMEATGTGIEHMAERSPFSAASKQAILVSIDLHFGLARMFEIFADRRNRVVQVFRDPEAAYAWLGVSPLK